MLSKTNAVAAGFFTQYINLADGDDVIKAIKKNTKEALKLFESISGKKSNDAYAEGKWTLKELLRHLIDAERVFAYRALSFARKDKTTLPSFDENSWAKNSGAANCKWKDLVEEFSAVRQSTELLFASFSEDQLLAFAIASDREINVIALGFIIAGHTKHHLNLIRERYLK